MEKLYKNSDNSNSMRDTSHRQLGFYISATIFGLLLSLSVVGFLLFATSPRDIGPFGVTIWFIALFILITLVVTLLRYRFSYRRHPELHQRVAIFKLSLRTSSVMGLFITVGFAMQSLRMLNLGDILLFLLTLAIIELYFRTKRP